MATSRSIKSCTAASAALTSWTRLTTREYRNDSENRPVSGSVAMAVLRDANLYVSVSSDLLFAADALGVGVHVLDR